MRGTGLARRLKELRAAARRKRLLDEAQARVHWWHSIDLGDDVITKGYKSRETLTHELACLQLPDLAGKTVLDIGTWDGFFSFAAEERGAARVVSFDSYVWSIDFDEYWRYIGRCRDAGETPRPYHEVPGVWRPDTMPGRRSFDLARELRGSKVEPHVGNFETFDPAELGTFDVVLFLGVLYHLEDPISGLKKLARLCNDFVAIETEAICVQGYEDQPLWMFFPTDELDGDPTNWWAPNAAGLEAALRAAGFGRVELDLDHEATAALPQGEITQYRIIGRAWKEALPIPKPAASPEQD